MLASIQRGIARLRVLWPGPDPLHIKWLNDLEEPLLKEAEDCLDKLGPKAPRKFRKAVQERNLSGIVRAARGHMEKPGPDVVVTDHISQWLATYNDYVGN